MIVLSKPQILMMHKSLIEETGGLDGIRDENLSHIVSIRAPNSLT